MALTLRQLQIFLAVADHGSTAAAADAVALSQSAASAALNELESLLGAQLFDRVGRRLVLNDNGRLLLPQARHMGDAAASIERQFAGGAPAVPVGLRIGASTTIGSYLLPAILAGFARRHGRSTPQVSIANTAAVAAAVAEFRVDLGLIEGPCHQPGLHVEPWLSDRMIVVAAPGHALAGGGKLAPAALRGAGWLLRESGSGTREAVEHALVPHLHYLHPAGEFSNSEAIKYAAAAGLGIACLSRVVVADLLAGGQLVELDTALPPLQRHFYLIHHERKMLSPRLAAFLQTCREYGG
ncbi:LysR family transcriptional regulator [Janthinobacterium fluminis]|uniref:LysR family transcriptional regulator n=1 Tax=Janthinobacterium fluminis TaxID=2987524 RepID=A0ABT5JW06_9BURK|nr:LysR family transcriptional regulator [Janthinobacterium fluminis]MDC8756799.1 LysR family transcriptional regulator [Janthinobacterium fluminis]